MLTTPTVLLYGYPTVAEIPRYKLFSPITKRCPPRWVTKQNYLFHASALEFSAPPCINPRLCFSFCIIIHQDIHQHVGSVVF